ncbi:hypothetical protein C8J57DRAFT_1614641 [Mycena rebaudengoi]|nr:hypothetical protein C8J57DRAFT_1614641 [Mycena rebaudengoi]
MSPSTIEVPYAITELKHLKKRILVAMVKRQEDKWPGPDVYGDRSTTISRLRKVLLDPRYGFTKETVSVARHRSLSTVTPSDSSGNSSKAQEINPTSTTVQARSPDIPHPARWVKLLIEDKRTSAKRAQEVSLDVSDEDGCGSGEWRAQFQDLLVKLQKSNTAITGAVKLSVRDPQDPEYWIPFVKTTSDVALEEAPTFPQFIIISSKSLEILADEATETNDRYNVNDGKVKPLALARRRATAGMVNGAGAGRSGGEKDNDTEWLKGQLQNTPGYQNFKDNQRRVQTNTGVIESWKFIANFTDTHYGQGSHVPRRKKIQKQSITKALGLGATAHHEAEKAARLVGRYGEGGTHEAQAVIDEINLEEDPPKGARALYPFLVQWDRDHK